MPKVAQIMVEPKFTLLTVCRTSSLNHNPIGPPSVRCEEMGPLHDKNKESHVQSRLRWEGKLAKIRKGSKKKSIIG